MHAAIKELSIKSNTTAKPLKMKDLMQHYKIKFSKNNQHTKQQYNNSKINEINIFEVENAIKKLKTKKSSREDNIFSEELKLLRTNMKKTVTIVLKRELQSNNFPQSIFNYYTNNKKGQTSFSSKHKACHLTKHNKKTLIINNTQ